MAYGYAFTDTRTVLTAVVYSNGELTPTQIASLETTLNATMSFTYQPNQVERSLGLNIGKVKLENMVWVPYSRILTKYGFNKLFTLNELVALQVASKTDDIVTVLQNKFNIADEIDLDDPAVVEGLQYLVSIGVLTAERVTEILL